jgi:hypothetical protein
MKNKILIGFILILFLPFELLANECKVLLPNSSAKISTVSSSKCINIKHVNTQKTYFVADPSFQKNSTYNIKVTTVAGATILNKNQPYSGGSTSAKLNTHHNTEVQVTLTPLTSDMKYSFFVVHDENTITGETTIYIGLHSKLYNS